MFNLINTVHAQVFSNTLKQNPAIKDIMAKVSDNIVSPIVAVLFLVAFVVFVYGMFEMISSQDDSDKRKNGKNAILWGVIGMVIMVSVYGIIRLIANTLGVGDPFI